MTKMMKKRDMIKCWKYWKQKSNISDVCRSQNISNDNIWDRGPMEYDTTQLSSRSNLLIVYQKNKFFTKYWNTFFQYIGRLPFIFWSYDKIPDTRGISTSRRIFLVFNSFFGLTKQGLNSLTFSTFSSKIKILNIQNVFYNDQKYTLVWWIRRKMT